MSGVGVDIPARRRAKFATVVLTMTPGPSETPMHPLPPPGGRPRLRPLRRPDGSVQLGVGARSLRLTGLTEAECRWVATLDPSRSLSEAVSAAALHGVDPVRSTELLDRLVGSGLLHPVDRAETPEVAVVGSGALPALLVDVLRQSERVDAVRVRPGAEGEVSPELAVVVSGAPAAVEAVRPWISAGVPVLPVWCLPEQASVGPLLRRDRGPCLTCLELTRVGVDPGWPWLRAQLGRAHVAGSEPVDGLPAIRLLAAGLTTTLVLDEVGGRLTTPEWSFEVATPGPTLERHRWPAHPGCHECGARPAAPVTTPTGDARCSPRTGMSDTMTG